MMRHLVRSRSGACFMRYNFRDDTRNFRMAMNEPTAKYNPHLLLSNVHYLNGMMKRRTVDVA